MTVSHLRNEIYAGQPLL